MGILNVATYVTVDGQYVNVLEMNQYQNKIRFLQLTGTSGTLTSEQINLLRSDNTNYIIVDNELYNCNDLQDANGYLVYTHTCADASNNVNIKTLSITLTNNNWSIQTTPVQPKIPVANTNEAVQFAEDERQKSKNLFGILKTCSITRDNITITINSDTQKILINGTASSAATISFSSDEIVPISVKNGEHFTISKTPNVAINVGINNKENTSGSIIYVYNTEKAYTNTITQDDKANRLYFWYDTGDTFNNVEFGIQVEEGSVATEYQPYNGAIVHEKDIAGVEHIETIYDVTNTSLNMGYSGGINGDLGTDIPYDFTRYKKVIATCCTEDIDTNQYSSMFSFELDLFKKTTNITNPYRAIATVLNPYVVMSANATTQLVCAIFEIGYSKTYFTYKAYLKNGENPAALLSNAKLIKLEGIY